MNPKISIIVPVYKVEKYIRRCIDSVLAQTFTDWELILVDDGSPDSSGKMCDEYSAKDSRIKTFHKENGGASSARNRGMDESLGYWINFLDADDWLAEDYLQKLIDASINVDFVTSGMIRPHSDGTIDVMESIDFFAPDAKTIGEGMVMINQHYLLNSQCTKLFRRDYIQKANLKFKTGISVSEDMIFVHQYIKLCSSLRCIKYAGYFYRQNVSGSLTKTTFGLDVYKESRDEIFNLRNQYINIFSITEPSYRMFLLKGYFNGTMYCRRGLGSKLSISYYRDLIKLIDDDLLREYVNNYDVKWQGDEKFFVECINKNSVRPAITHLIRLIIRRITRIAR